MKLMNNLKLILLLSLVGVVLLFGNANKPIKENIMITLSGELKSQNSTRIIAPRNWNLNYKILYLPEEGSWVEKGDTVVVFDSKEVEQQLDEARQQLEQLEKQMVEKQLRNQQTIKEIKNQIRTLEIQKEITLNQLEQSKYNSEADQKTVELELKKVELNIKKTRQTLESQKILNRNDENETNLQLEQYRTRMKNYREMIDDMVMTSPKSGIVVYHKTGRRGRGAKVKIGDSIRPASIILQIPDLNNMQVDIDLSEVDISKIKLGQPAEIQVLAYPDTTFLGEVAYISKIADESEESKLRIYPISVNINSPKNYRMKPGLTVKVSIEIGKNLDGFSIPAWCLFKDADGYFVRTATSRLPVAVIDIYDGKAYVSGALTSDMELKENINIPNF
ncbi:MAG: HlyD family secretion protein [Fidelibacterota bacterium]